MRKVLVYENNGICPVENFFANANMKIQGKFKFLLDYVKDESNPLSEPNIEHFSQRKYRQLYQMRIKKSDTLVRVVFYKKDDDIILLYAFYKRDNKDTKKAMETSLKILHSLFKKEENIVCREMI